MKEENDKVDTKLNVQSVDAESLVENLHEATLDNKNEMDAEPKIGEWSSDKNKLENHNVKQLEVSGDRFSDLVGVPMPLETTLPVGVLEKSIDVEYFELSETLSAEVGKSYSVNGFESSGPTYNHHYGHSVCTGWHMDKVNPLCSIQMNNPDESDRYFKGDYTPSIYDNRNSVFPSDIVPDVGEIFDYSQELRTLKNPEDLNHSQFTFMSHYFKDSMGPFHFRKPIFNISSNFSRDPLKRDKEPILLQVKTLRKTKDMEKIQDFERKQPSDVSNSFTKNTLEGGPSAYLPTWPKSAKVVFDKAATKYLGRTSSAPSSVRPSRLMCKVAPIKDAKSNPNNTETHSKECKENFTRIEQFTNKLYQNLDDKKNLSKSVRSFYKKQNALIEAIQEESVDKPQRVTNTQHKISFYAKVSFFANLVLLIAKTTAAVVSGSMAIISSLVDSVVDLVSGIVIWITARAIKRTDFLQYPHGKKRLEPLGVIILSVIMGIASLQLVKESIEKIIGLANFTQHPPTVEWPTIVISVATIVTKFGLYIMCRNVDSPTVKALAQDHRNDVLSNTLAIVCGYVGSQEVLDKFKFEYLVHVDPIGAIVISLYIAVTWYVTGKENAKILAGKSAKPDIINKLVWIILNHHKDISQIKVIKVFHSGYHYHVEACIQLPAESALSKAADISSSLEKKLEKLVEIDHAVIRTHYNDRNFKYDGYVVD